MAWALLVHGGDDRVLAPETREGAASPASARQPIRNVACVIGISLPQPAEAPHVDHVAHRVHHAARAQEQQGLEERVREQVEHAGR